MIKSFSMHSNIKKLPCSDAPVFFSPLMANFPCCYLIAVLESSWKALKKLCVLGVILGSLSKHDGDGSENVI